MAKDQDFRNRFGANLAESMGANRVSGAGGAAVEAKADRLDGTERLRAAALIEVDRIVPDPDQPRKEFDEGAIDRLAASLVEHGQIQPIAVRWSESMGRYLVVSGERRWRASMKAGRKTIAAVIVEGEKTDSQILEMQLVENCLREDLQPVEQARAFRTLMDRNAWPALRLAQTLHMSESTIIKALALLTLPCTVQDRVESGELAPSVAYEVSKLANPDDQAEVAARVVAEGMNRAEAIEAVRHASKATMVGGSKGRGAIKARPKRPTIRTVKTTAAKVTVEFRKAVEPAEILAALREAVARLELEVEGQAAA